MSRLAQDFTAFLLETGALSFGDFTLRSGRRSSYMVNTGKFDSGESLLRLGEFYAASILEKTERGDLPAAPGVIFGAAYKGIPLAAATSIALARKTGEDIKFTFNRKEAKDHGEGGVLIGYTPRPADKILIIDDVMTAGTALRETMNILETAAPQAKVIGCAISVDRAERGTGERSAVAEASETYGFPIFPIASIYDILDALKKGSLASPAEIAAIENYLSEYGAIQKS